MILRKIILPLLFLFPIFVFSQEFNGGIKLGISSSQITGDRLSGFKKAGIFGGPFVNLYITEYTSIQIELNFTQKGSRRNIDSTFSFKPYLLRLNYIEIPILYKYDLTQRFVFEAGLSYGYLINSHETVDESTNAASGIPFHKFDLSASIGLYYRLLENTSLNIRYSHSILPVRQNASGQTYRLNKGQLNQVLSFALTFNMFSRVYESENIQQRE